MNHIHTNLIRRLNFFLSSDLLQGAADRTAWITGVTRQQALRLN